MGMEPYGPELAKIRAEAMRALARPRRISPRRSVVARWRRLLGSGLIGAGERVAGPRFDRASTRRAA